jgi:nucleoside-diphosphate-sugar epimerase
LRTLIAGCGYAGTALAEVLAETGYEVYGLRRRADSLPRTVQGISADLGDPATLRDLPEGLDWVVYAAGADGFSEEAYRAAYVTGPRNLVAALQAQGQMPRRLLFTSSTGVYAQTDGEWVDEDSPTKPTTFSGTALLEGEGIFHDAPWPSVVLRLGGIYGPGRTGLIERVRSGNAKREPEPSRWLNLNHRDDIVGAIRHLLEIENPRPCYVGADSEPQVWNELVTWLAEHLGVPTPPIDTEPASRRPARSRRCSNRRLLESGYRFRYPSCREGYADLL